jgi:hypothetical protein
MKSRQPVALLLAAAVVLIVGYLTLYTEIGRAFTGRWSFTRSVELDRGTYYRLKVKVTYKGEPQDFNIVVGCNVKQTNYKDGSRTVESGLVPEVFARRLSDGKALAVNPPQACNGETTADGRVPQDLLPLLIVYDNADNLAFGTAYFSEDAYENPLAVLKFGGATIERATRAEFDEFRRTQPNALTEKIHRRYLPGEMSKTDARDTPYWASQCYGFARYQLPDDIRAVARKYWASEHPRFWETPSFDALKEISGALTTSKALRSDGADGAVHTPMEFAYATEPFYIKNGLATRAGRGRVASLPGNAFPPAVYPDIKGWGELPWPADPFKAAERILRGNARVENSLDFRGGATRGFAYCSAPVEYYARFFPTEEKLRAAGSKWGQSKITLVVLARPSPRTRLDAAHQRLRDALLEARIAEGPAAIGRAAQRIHERGFDRLAKQRREASWRAALLRPRPR